MGRGEKTSSVGVHELIETLLFCANSSQQKVTTSPTLSRSASFLLLPPLSTDALTGVRFPQMPTHHHAHLSLYLRNASLMSKAGASDGRLRRPAFKVGLTVARTSQKEKATPFFFQPIQQDTVRGNHRQSTQMLLRTNDVRMFHPLRHFASACFLGHPLLLLYSFLPSFSNLFWRSSTEKH